MNRAFAGARKISDKWRVDIILEKALRDNTFSG